MNTTHLPFGDIPTDPSGAKARPQFPAPALLETGLLLPPRTQAEQLALFEVCPVGHELTYREVVSRYRGGGLWWIFWKDGSLQECHMGDLEVSARIHFLLVVDRRAEEFPQWNHVGPMAYNVVQLNSPPVSGDGVPSTSAFSEGAPTPFPDSMTDMIADLDEETRGANAVAPRDTLTANP